MYGGGKKGEIREGVRENWICGGFVISDGYSLLLCVIATMTFRMPNHIYGGSPPHKPNTPTLTYSGSSVQLSSDS